jgi:hypothetical protein
MVTGMKETLKMNCLKEMEHTIGKMVTKYVGQLKNNQENGFGALVFSTKSNLL